jgi:hypothetical protein
MWERSNRSLHDEAKAFDVYPLVKHPLVVVVCAKAPNKHIVDVMHTLQMAIARMKKPPSQAWCKEDIGIGGTSTKVIVPTISGF